MLHVADQLMLFLLFYSIFYSKVCEFMLKLSNSSGGIVYCRVLLLSGLNFEKILYGEDSEYGEAVKSGLNVIKVLSREDAPLEVDIQREVSSVRRGILSF